ncbi:HD domain-containing phosphohydrolase [Undibacterium cyanobacteriorum]|uniref:HD domain-containing phosphohydrolase n=1 Tax=Undibacterium cyanobacteriorum TaxID=3073561 RepID=A0ABY9RF55_9BURK|nr:HD domain-containing phosphohydrolase [Undibacterium sp. 20NA77.5]WMW79474.1 HD domain-containing phosphohydrolase [Undibacterium sp. 20NA77.5]
MSNKRISMSDIVLGQPLQWDIYGNDGNLLLRKGFVVNSSHQVEVLIERGLYVDSDKLDQSSRDKKIPKVVELPSVVRIVTDVRADLRTLSYNLVAETEARSKFLALAKQIVVATFLDTDVALGCILLHQEGNYSARHCVDTAIVAIVIARALKKSEEEITMLAAAALTMNLSMLRQQERLQEKSDGLSAEEQELIYRHPQETVEQLMAAGVKDEAWLSWILAHHENEDGSGYPLKKRGPETPQNAKIISIADRYCARVCARSYRKSLLPNAALRDILIGGKTTVDLMLVTLFIRELGTYPIGTFVKLENGEIGVVTSKGATTTTPYVHSLIGPRGAPLTMPIKRDTQKPLHAIREVLHRDQVPIRFTMRQLWGEIAAQ